MSRRILILADAVLYMFGLADNPVRRYRHPEGITHDWQMVGRDIANAIDQYSHGEN